MVFTGYKELLSFDDFLESFESKGILKYLAQHPLLEQVPSLKDDIEGIDLNPNRKKYNF